jgi:biotin operon repressor
MKLKVKNQLTVTRIAILGTQKLNKWKSNELDLIALSLGKLRSDLWNEFGSLKAWGVSKFEIDKQLRTLKDKYQLPAKLWKATLYDVIDNIHLVQAACVEKVMKFLGQSFQSFQAKKGVLQLTLESREWLEHPRLCTLVR